MQVQGAMPDGRLNYCDSCPDVGLRRSAADIANVAPAAGMMNGVVNIEYLYYCAAAAGVAWSLLVPRVMSSESLRFHPESVTLVEAPAIGHLYTRCRGLMVATAARLGGVSAAEDLVQDASVNALKRFDGFRGDATPVTWLMRILINRAIDQNRQFSRRATYSLETESLEALHRATPSHGLRVDLERALRSLDARSRRLVLLFDVLGYTYTEISESLNIPVGTAKSRHFAARRRLRASLGSATHGVQS
jgi:RNA polymerase sigma-70 factor (ECF subfamily)